MNSAVITKIEYRVFPEVNFSAFEIIPYSGKLSEDISETKAGNVYACVVDFNVAKSEQAKDTTLKSVLKRKAQFRVIDANNIVYLVGDENYPARLVYSRGIDGTPGSFNGYKCKINRKSPYAITIDT